MSTIILTGHQMSLAICQWPIVEAFGVFGPRFPEISVQSFRVQSPGPGSSDSKMPIVDGELVYGICKRCPTWPNSIASRLS